MTAATPGPPSQPGHQPDEETVEPLYPTVELWVEDIFTRTWTAPGRGRWCTQWWKHADAIVALTALWQSWEAARIDPDPRALADWLTRYLLPLRDHLTSEDTGPFAACSADTPRHTDPRALPIDPAPHGYWPETDCL